MSAQILRFEPRVVGRPADPPFRLPEPAEEYLAVSGLPFEVAYLAVYGRETGPEDLALEYFLLDCD